MTIKETFVADLKATLEETSNIMADRIILESLAKHGSVTLDEAEFYDKLVRRVITEAAEDFVPEKIDLPEVAEEAPVEANPFVGADGDVMTLTGEDGTVYSYNPATGELIPVEGVADAVADEVDENVEGLEGQLPEEIAEEMPAELKESTEVEVEAEAIEESTEVEVEVEAEVELTESQMIVSNLIKSLGN